MLGKSNDSHMEDKIMQNISRENADIIGEVANICIGNAATTLSMILTKTDKYYDSDCRGFEKERMLSIMMIEF